MGVATTRFDKYSIGDFVFGAAETTKELAVNGIIGVKGEVAKCLVTVPNFTNAVNAVVSVENEDSFEIWASGALPEAEDYDITLARGECILQGKSTEKFKVTLSGVPGGSGGTVSVTIYIKT